MSFNKDTNKYEGYIYLINNNINGETVYRSNNFNNKT